MNKSSLMKKSVLYLIGNVSSKLIFVIILPIYAFYVSAESLGQFDYTQTITNIIVPLVYMAIWEAILKYLLSSDNEKEIEEVISTTIVFIICMSAIFLMIIILFSRFFLIKNLLFLCCMVITNGINQIYQYYSRGLKKNQIFVISGVASTIVNSILILLLVVVFRTGLVGLYLSYVFGQLCSILVIEGKLRVLSKVSYEKVSLQLLKRMLLFSGPLVLNLISAWLMSGYARMFITTHWGAYENGLYSFANKFSQFVTVFGNVVVMAMIEEAILSRIESGFSKKFSDTINNICKLFFFFIFMLFPIIKIFFSWIGSNSEYSSALPFVPLLLLYTLFMVLSSTVGSIFQVIEKTNFQFLTTLIGGFFTVVVSVLLVQKIGIYSVIIGQVLGSLSMYLSRVIFAQRYIKLDLSPLKYFIFGCIFVLYGYMLIGAGVVISIITEILIVMLFLWTYKDECLKYYRVLKNKFFNK